MADPSAIRAALEIGAPSTLRARTVDITTTGARTGRDRRTEIWFHQIDGRWYLTGRPPRPRAWYRNLVAHPRFTFHLKHGVQADLAATARPITDLAERRRVLGAIVDSLNDPTNPAGFPNRPPVEEWVAQSPLVEILFDAVLQTPGA